MIGVEDSKIVDPLICPKCECDAFVKCIYSKCSYGSEIFQECRDSGYIEHFEEK